jgi:hypothetical protein
VCTSALRPHLTADWSAPVPDLDFTVSSVLAHASLGPLWYALDLWGGETDSAGWALSVAEDTSPPALLAGLTQASQVCAAAVDAAPPDLLGFHPAGSPDRSGFAAMACAELLIHTDDALRGLSTRLAAPGPLAAAVLARVFPDLELGADPWQSLLWAHDRPTSLTRPRDPGTWSWRPAPLG